MFSATFLSLTLVGSLALDSTATASQRPTELESESSQSCHTLDCSDDTNITMHEINMITTWCLSHHPYIFCLFTNQWIDKEIKVSNDYSFLKTIPKPKLFMFYEDVLTQVWWSCGQNNNASTENQLLYPQVGDWTIITTNI